MKWDMTDQIFVWHRFISECFHQHILPLWCPYSRLGYPFFADPQSGLFYPVTWIFTYFFHYSLYTNDLEFILHVIGAAFGMKYLLESLQVSRFTACVFGLVYALSGPFVSNASHIVFIYSLCWMPFILGSYIRVLQTGDYRYAVLMSIFLFLQISGGYIGLSIILFYVLVLVVLYYLFFFFSREPEKMKALIVNHFLVGAVTLLFSAGFVFAVLKGLPFIDRQNGVSREMTNSMAFTPMSFLTFLYPGISDNDRIQFGTDLTMRNIYMGLFTLLLVFVSFISPRRIKLFILGGSIFCLLAAMGDHTPIRSWLYSYVPLMNVFRMAAIFRFFSCLGFITLAAYAFDEIFEKRSEISIKAIKNISAITFFLLLISCAVLLTKYYVLQLPTLVSVQRFTEFLKHTNIRTVIVLFNAIQMLLLGASFLILRSQKSNSFKKYAIAALIVADMGMAVQSNIFSTIVCDRSLTEVQAQLDKLPIGFPIVSNVPLLTYNQWNNSTLAPPIWHNAGFLRKQVTFDGYNGYNLNVYNLLADRNDFYKIIAERNFISTPDSLDISITKFDPDHIFFKSKSDRNGTASIGQFFYPGWHLRVDGVPSKLMEDSLHLMKCDITRGDHMVEMSFEPEGARFVFIYTIAAFVIGLIWTAVLFLKPLIL